MFGPNLNRSIRDTPCTSQMPDATEMRNFLKHSADYLRVNHADDRNLQDMAYELERLAAR